MTYVHAVRVASASMSIINRDTFEALLETARALRRRQRRAPREAAAPAAAVPTRPDRINVRSVRRLTGLSQAKFSELLGIELSTLRNWEQGRRAPTGPGRALLRAIRNDPVGVIKALTG
jgi:DNA-binding transcriptional regulator YiaG